MVQYARPNSDVSTGRWTPSGGSTLWEMLDEATADDDTTYVGSAPLIVHPTADIDTSGWANAPLWSKIDETTPDAVDYAETNDLLTDAATLQYDGVVSNSGWTAVGAATELECIDEVTSHSVAHTASNEDTDYISASTVGAKIRFSVPSLVKIPPDTYSPTPGQLNNSSTPTWVRVVNTGGAGSVTLRVTMYEGATVRNVVTFSQGSGAEYVRNPLPMASMTQVRDFNNIEVEIEITEIVGTMECRISASYVVHDGLDFETTIASMSDPGVDDGVCVFMSSQHSARCWIYQSGVRTAFSTGISNPSPSVYLLGFPPSEIANITDWTTLSIRCVAWRASGYVIGGNTDIFWMNLAHVYDGFTVGLSSVSDPGTGIGHTLRYRWRGEHAGANFGQYARRTTLLQGTTVIATRTDDLATLRIPTTWQTSEMALVSAEADAITDYTALRVKIEFFIVKRGVNASGEWLMTMSFASYTTNNDALNVRVTQVELEVPDAAPTAQPLDISHLEMAIPRFSDVDERERRRTDRGRLAERLGFRRPSHRDSGERTTQPRRHLREEPLEDRCLSTAK